MKEFTEAEKNETAETPAWQQIPRRLRFLMIFLFILVALSFCTLGFLIGRTGQHEHFAGRIVDTISIGSGQNFAESPEMIYQINIRGRVIYADGTPYQYGRVELRSTPRYTTTDSDGRFEFTNVQTGRHTISVFRGDTVVATSIINIEREVLLTSTQIVKLADNTYLILAPLDLPEIDLLFRVPDIDGGSLQPGLKEPGDAQPGGSPGTQPGSGANPRPPENLEIVLDPDPLPPTAPLRPTPPGPTTPDPAPPGPTPPGPTPPGPTTPDPTPVEPNPPVIPGGGGGSGGSGGSSGSGGGTPPSTPTPPPDRAPGVNVGDDLTPAQIWTNLTSVDIFAERAGNFGVQTIGGQNVIAPGSHGSYAFRVKNPEALELEYTVSLSETDGNNPRLPMKYRLKRGTGGADYLGGDAWKSADSLSLGWTPIAPGAVSYYTLEWKWVQTNDATDTAIGMQDGSPVYLLNIIVSAQFK